MNEQISLQLEIDSQVNLRTDFNSTKDNASNEIVNTKENRSSLEHKNWNY